MCLCVCVCVRLLLLTGSHSSPLFRGAVRSFTAGVHRRVSPSLAAYPMRCVVDSWPDAQFRITRAHTHTHQAHVHATCVQVSAGVAKIVKCPERIFGIELCVFDERWVRMAVTLPFSFVCLPASALLLLSATHPFSRTFPFVCVCVSVCLCVSLPLLSLSLSLSRSFYVSVCAGSDTAGPTRCTFRGCE